MTTILALLGSPKPNGTNSLLIDEVLRGAAAAGDVEVQKILINELKVAPCQSCDYCMHTGRCRLRDDMESVYEKIVAMDAFIFAAPVYFNGMSAQAKAVVDRCQPFWSAKYIVKTDVFGGRKRPGIFIATGGQPLYNEQFIGSLHVINLYFKMIGVNNSGTLTLADLDARPLAGRPDDLAQAFALGRKLIAGDRHNVS
ncbi:flavodoxin family protein [Sporomusa termitida]|uniref:NADPH-dependent FMN reductase n=1 Tax=Sporomusa termitida TaxID=2377 RepID=A0A517DPY9_9FIRM|nr:flavodoxin family protein [Sporomusa termitida]QDR79435.1 NADPH-dependent FMN reductase [Sporomusa termitida]